MSLVFLPRPPVPDMPVHMLDRARTAPPPVPPRRWSAADRVGLGGLIYQLLRPPLHRAPAREWPQWSVPDFVPREGRHPDLGWPMTRLVCPPDAERWYREEELWEPWQDDGDFVFFHVTDQKVILSYCEDPTEGASTVEITEAGILCPSDHLDELDIALIEAVQGVTGLAAYTQAPAARRLVLEPLLCGVCQHQFVLRLDQQGDARGCELCGSEWVWVMD